MFPVLGVGCGPVLVRGPGDGERRLDLAWGKASCLAQRAKTLL